MKENKKLKNITLIVWSVCILLGIFLILKPATSVKMVGYIFGAICLGIGIFRITGSFKKNGNGIFTSLDMISGVISVLVGGFIVIRPQVVLSILPVIIGIYVLIESLFKIQKALFYKNVGYSRWWASFTVSILTLILGAILIFNPFETMVITVRLIGIAICVIGIFNISNYFISANNSNNNGSGKNKYIDI